MFHKRLCALCFTFCCAYLLAQQNDILTASDLINQQGFKAEEMNVITFDGYSIHTIRIPRDNSPPVLFMPGILQGSGSWVVNTRDKALSFMLADQGYDIWIVDFRGTKNSPVKKDQSWEFSFYEMGKYDLPVVIDYILKTTGRSSLTLVSHSMGAAVGMVYLTEYPECQSKVNLFVNLAPAIFVNHTTSTLFEIFDTIHLFDILKILGIKSFNGASSLNDFLALEICETLQDLCELAIADLAGYDLSEADKKRIGIYLSQIDSTSVTTFIHGYQIKHSDIFRKFDYGVDQNKKIYGTDEPPEFPISTLNKTPVGVYFGTIDKMVDRSDAIHYLKLLDPSIIVVQKEIREYGHADLLYSENVDFWKEIIHLINNYAPV